MILVALLILLTPLWAEVRTEEAVGVEVGTLFGLSHLSSSEEGITMVGAPGGFGGVSGNPSLYVSFLGEKLSLGWESSFASVFAGEDARSSHYFGARGAYFPKGNAMSNAYVLGHGALMRASDGYDSDTDFSTGAGLGFQLRLGPAFVMRVEARYRRWFDDQVDDYSLLFGLGTRM